MPYAKTKMQTSLIDASVQPDQRLCISCLIQIISVPEIPGLFLASVAEQAV